MATNVPHYYKCTYMGDDVVGVLPITLRTCVHTTMENELPCVRVCVCVCVCMCVCVYVCVHGKMVSIAPIIHYCHWIALHHLHVRTTHITS